MAPISHRTSALGQWATALWRRASKDSLKHGQTRSVGKKKKERDYKYVNKRRNEEIPGAVALLKIRSSEPNAFFAGKHLESVCVNGSGTLKGSVGHTLKHIEGAAFNWDAMPWFLNNRKL